jgi:hypothetical protein
MKFVFAITYAQAIRAFVDQGDDALRAEIERWEPEARSTVARALAEVACRPELFRKITNFAGVTGATPITRTSRPLSMSS